jgi:hypothetical protein
MIPRWQVVGKIGETKFVAAPYTARGDGVYVRATDYDALVAAARDVCWYDWSDRDEDVRDAIATLQALVSRELPESSVNVAHGLPSTADRETAP